MCVCMRKHPTLHFNPMCRKFSEKAGLSVANKKLTAADYLRKIAALRLKNPVEVFVHNLPYDFELGNLPESSPSLKIKKREIVQNGKSERTAVISFVTAKDAAKFMDEDEYFEFLGRKYLKTQIWSKAIGLLDLKTKLSHPRWTEKLVGFQKKWRNDPFLAEYKVDPEVENLKMVRGLELDWAEMSGAKQRVFERAGLRWKTDRAEIFGDCVENVAGEKEEERVAFEKWAAKWERLVTLTSEERLQYARMVRHVEDEHETKWGEAERDLARWDEKWPRFILPDGTAAPSMMDVESVAKFKERLDSFERKKNSERESNKSLSAVLSEDRIKDLTDLLVLIKLFLLKLGSNSAEVANYVPQTTSNHAFLAKLSSSAEELESPSLAGSASAHFADSRAFVRTAKAEAEALARDGAAEPNEALFAELTLAVRDAEATLSEVAGELQRRGFCDPQPQRAANAAPAQPSAQTDPRLSLEGSKHTAHRVWALVLQRQQALFDALPQNAAAVRKQIAESLAAAALQKGAERLAVRGRPRTGVAAVDEHFEKLVAAIDAAGNISAERRMEFFRRIPSTVGGPGPDLAEVPGGARSQL